jgi:hypothetical protein
VLWILVRAEAARGVDEATQGVDRTELGWVNGGTLAARRVDGFRRRLRDDGWGNALLALLEAGNG